MEKGVSSTFKYKWLITSFVIGVACWLSFSFLSQGTLFVSQQPKDLDFDASIPQARLSPSEVVTLQVNSIRASVDDASKLKICYSLASKDNRSHTGPFPRFREMVTLPPYDQLANCLDWQLGGTVVDKEFAAVLVSTISRKGEVSGFRFILQRQINEAELCWMTEGVEYVVEQSVEWKPVLGSDSELKIE